MRIAILAFLISLPAAAQWFNQPDPRLPRGKDGKPILTGKAPRTPDGKPDLTGLWVRREGESAPPNTAGLGFSLQWWMPKGAEIPLRPAFSPVLDVELKAAGISQAEDGRRPEREHQRFLDMPGLHEELADQLRRRHLALVPVRLRNEDGRRAVAESAPQEV